MSGQLSLFEAPPKPRAPSFLDGLEAGDVDGLRYYQRDAVNAFHAAVAGGFKRPLIVMATGLGKTQTFGAIAKHWSGRVLVLAHREELVFQAQQRIEQMTGETVGVEKASLFSRAERVVVGSVQTVTKTKRLERLLALGGFGLIIVDEAHHCVAKSFRKVLDFFPEVVVLGVTATPWRTDKKALGRVFDTVCYEKNILSGISEGFLVPLEGCAVDITALDISQVTTTVGDFAQGQLDHAVLEGVEGIVQKTLELHGRRRGPIFFPGKMSATVAAARFNALKSGCAAVVTDDTDPVERKAIMSAVKDGRIQYLCNVMVATEGFDWPEADMVGLARPTKSVTIYTQMIGRGTRVTADVNSIPEQCQAAERTNRIAQSSKQYCVIVDFVGNCGKHDPVGLVDIFQGDFTDSEVKKAKSLIREEAADAQIADPTAMLLKARRELARMAAAVKATVKATVSGFDVFAATGISRELSEEFRSKFGYQPASESQKAYLLKCGVKDVYELSKSDAKRAISAINVRREKNLATVKQLSVLQRQGWENRNISFETARTLIDHCRNQNWRASVESLQAIVDNRKRTHEHSDIGRVPGSGAGIEVHSGRPSSSEAALGNQQQGQEF